MKPLLLFLGCTLLWANLSADPYAARFTPPPGKILVFAGQDNESVGGTLKHRDGYVDNVEVPAGITHYVYFAEGWTNDFNRTFAKGKVDGLNSETEWAAGPMNQKAYLDSPTLDRCIMHLSISMEGNSEDKVADGSYDHLIKELVDFVRDHPDHPFLIRIGYEFDGNWNGYDANNFKLAFQRIVKALQAAKLSNYATVYASSSGAKPEQFVEYDPGPEYYDWVGYSWWGGDKDGQAAIDFARKVGKPIFIAEATPRGIFFDKQEHKEIWNTWFAKFFAHIEKNKDVVRAISYINADWDSQDMWDGWGQSRLETAPYLKSKWLEKMAEPRFVNASDKPFGLIGFGKGIPSVAAAQPIQAKFEKAYMNPNLPVELRVKDLLGRMTLEEKVAQITGWWDPSEEKLLSEGNIFKPEFYAQKCPQGIGELGPLHNLTVEDDARQYAAVQDYFRNNTRLGIPAILHDEAAHGFMRFEANSFPTPIGISCSWNPELLKEIYSQAAREARSRGISHILSPIVDVARDLRWGRVDETLGEDPFLVGRLGAAMVEGLQGSTDGSVAPGHVAATLKHFAGYAATEGGRNRSPYLHGRRQLLDTEIYPFRHVIQSAKPAAVMAAFNEVEGLPCHVNPWVLTHVLRERIGFQGLTIGDYQGIDLVRKYQKIGSSDAEAARMALEAGLHLELPNNFGFKHLPRLVREGKVRIETIDRAVRQVLRLKFRLGLFEAPATLDLAKAKALSRSPEARALSRRAAVESIVLLKNEAGLLPLRKGQHKTIAVIGPNAKVCRLGNYSGRPLRAVSLYEGIESFVGDSSKLLFAEGCKIAHNDTGDSYSNWRYVNEVDFATLEDNKQMIEQAVQVARQADLVILAIGENVLLSREAWGGNHVGDRTTMDLTESQQVLARRIIETGKPVITFLNNSKPVTLGDLLDNATTLLTAHYAGQETGNAAADVLFGQANPSGKLTLSWPRSVGNLPSHYSQYGSAKVFDYLDSPKGVVFPFGFGLSYTKFSYRNLKISSPEIRDGQTIQVTFELTNAGQRTGTEIAQLYLSGEGFPIARPSLELKGFARVRLQPGETRQVSLALHAEDLYFHDSELRRVLSRGTYKVSVGGSSQSLSQTVDLRVNGGGHVAATQPGKSTPTPTDPIVPAQLPPAQAKGKMNVLFLAIDDLRPELGAYGSKVKTPNMDRLASSGMLFQRAYCQQAVCGASRLSIMGGLYPALTGEQTFHVDGWRDRHPNLKTINQHFREQGFRTLGMGKIYHGHTGAGVDPMNWDQWINVKDPGHYASQDSLEQLRKAIEEGKVGSPRDPPKGPMTESADVHDDTYVDGKRAARAGEVIKQLAQNKDKPFFLAVGLSKPHLPFVAPAKYWNLYQRESFRMPPNAGIPPGYPVFAANQNAPEMKKYSDFEGLGPKDFSMATNQRLLHGYAAATSYVDACVGRILDSLERNGLADKTIVVLWGDHGWKLGDHSSWCKHTNFECDARVPLIVRDPRTQAGRTPRLIELIDLYPTLCDLTGIPIPGHCQGRSFRAVLEDPEAGHRLDAYSTYPAQKLMGHSIHHKHYRYTEWRDKENQTVSSVLTDLNADPGEVTNVKNEPKYAEALALVRERLAERIKLAAYSSYRKGTAPAGAPGPAGKPIRRQSLLVDPSPEKLRQRIDGFGGSIAFWGTNPDDEAMGIAFQELKTTILRAQGEVTRKGITDKNREVLQRAMKLNPNLEVMLTFWQPRSAGLLEVSDWLDVVEEESGKKYVLKPFMEEKWAEEIVKRTKLYLDWGINVKTLGVQNETNYSKIGTQTCIWDPVRLRSFLENHLKPRLGQAGLKVEITAPDLAFVGYKGSEVERFLPTIASKSVDLVAYHMYDSYKEDMDGSLSVLRENSRQIGKIRRENFPGKRFWMTETTGAQWNNDVWHTYGWKPGMTEYDKALLAAQYMHMTFADAGANAFLWWGLVYSLAPDKETNPKIRQKHRDEGLVLVEEKTGGNGRQKLIERTKKFFFFKQFANFALPGYRRVAVSSNETLWNSSYRSPDGKTLVVVTINVSGNQQILEPKVPGQPVAISAYQTDRSKNCERVEPHTAIPPRAIRTFVYKY